MNNTNIKDDLAELENYRKLEREHRLILLPCPEKSEVYYILGAPQLPANECCIERTFFSINDRHRIGVDMWLTKEEAYYENIQRFIQQNELEFSVDDLVTAYKQYKAGKPINYRMIQGIETNLEALITIKNKKR